MVFHDTKNAERRSAPLLGEALELARDRYRVRQIDTDLVFSREGAGRVAIEIPARETIRARHTLKTYWTLLTLGALLPELFTLDPGLVPERITLLLAPPAWWVDREVDPAPLRRFPDRERRELVIAGFFAA